MRKKLKTEVTGRGLHFHHLVGQRPAVLVGDGDIFPDRETVLAQAIGLLVVGGVALVVVEIPALAALHQPPVGRVLVGREAPHGAGVLGLAVGRLVQPAVVGQGRGQGVAAMVVAAGEFCARVAGKPHDDARQGHWGPRGKASETRTAKARLSSIGYASFPQR